MTLLAPIILVGIAIAWFSLPLLPTMIELQSKSEARPLTVDRDNDGEVRHFAKRFKAYLESNFQQVSLRECINDGVTLEGRFADGMPYRVSGGTDDSFLSAARSAREVSGIIVFSPPTFLPADMTFIHGIYAAAYIDCGQGSLIRSLYGERNVRLRQNTVVSRWIHTENRLQVEADCVLHGRATADHAMSIGPRVGFERLHAPEIVFEDDTVTAPRKPVALVPLLFRPMQAHEMAANCYSIDGDLDVLPETLIRGNYVVRGAIRIGRDARVEGSLKSQQDISVEPGALIEGSLVSAGALEIGANCQVRGPAVASRLLTVHAGCRIGNENYPTSAIAPSILIHAGVSVFGTVWARESGRVGG